MSFYDKDSQILNLSEKNLTVQSIPAICEFLIAYPMIDELSLVCNNPGDKGMEMLTANKTLLRINLMDTKFNDDNALQFALNTTLQTLIITYTNITLKGLIILAEGRIPDIKTDDRHRDILKDPNPMKRAQFGREKGFDTNIPSLSKLCLFAIKDNAKKLNPNTKLLEIPGFPELTDQINKARI